MDILAINNGVYEHEYRCPGGSALSAAALGGNKEIVSLLLEPEFRLSPSSSEYHRAILCAVRMDVLILLTCFSRCRVYLSMTYSISKTRCFGRQYVTIENPRSNGLSTMAPTSIGMVL